MNHYTVANHLRKELGQWLNELSHEERKQVVYGCNDMSELLGTLSLLNKNLRVNITDFMHIWRLNAINGNAVDRSRILAFQAIAGKLPEERSQTQILQTKIIMSRLKSNIPQDRQVANGYKSVIAEIESYTGKFPEIVIKWINKDIELKSKSLDDNDNLRSFHAAKMEIDGMKSAVQRYQEELKRPLNKIENKQEEEMVMGL